MLPAGIRRSGRIEPPHVEGFLTTPRIALRRFEAGDLESIVALDADPAVMRFINGGTPVPRERIERDFGPKLVEGWDPFCERDRRTIYCACDRGSGAFLGWFHVKPGRRWPEDLELGYRLARSAWGRGLATEGSIALRDFVFDRLKAPVLFGTTMRDNRASAHVLQKVGMTLECRFEEADWPGTDKEALKFSMRRPSSNVDLSPTAQLPANS
jgi:RimJ/RimL family protein N-acetyltransferase